MRFQSLAFAVFLCLLHLAVAETDVLHDFSDAEAAFSRDLHETAEAAKVSPLPPKPGFKLHVGAMVGGIVAGALAVPALYLIWQFAESFKPEGSRQGVWKVKSDKE
eukprot:TRINITY_DN48729_c0_g1_i1.p1 TRINITY_DN48729_c0_g1~~TRINITY_DN48729_c0_g1_i1.p1  ORF type:complete len:106 (-),score=18.34 TRINITY_DN48729_c0_g1_i1:147-464(-)